MNFTEFGFWPRFLLCLALAFTIKGILRLSGRKETPLFDKLALAGISLYLLSCVDFLTFSIFLTLTLLSYLGIFLISITPQNRRRLFLCFYIPLLLLPLIYFKYKTFFLEQVIGWEHLTFVSVAIPAGISFYTFQKIAILVDACRMPRYRPKFLDFINFAAFFPQVVAGPIERRDHLMPQMETFRLRLLPENIDRGIPYIAMGLFYKLCLADNLSGFINVDSAESAWPILLCTFLFGLKIYFDFCGYSLIALGLARCLGVELVFNFRSPYFSGNIREFWRRWHVSLSYWFRDYIYFPLGGGKVPYWWANLLIIFLVSGLWHGAGWGFILWGALHGVYSVISHACKGKITMPWLISWPLTMIFVFLAWLPFYETRWNVLLEKARILATPSAYRGGELMSLIKGFQVGDLATLGSLIVLCLFILGLEGLGCWRKKEDYSFCQNPVAVFLFLGGVIILGSTSGNSFIYFSF